MCINIVLITKQEKEYLVKHGVPYAEGGVSHSESCHKRKKFYLCETPHNMRLLENYRKKIISSLMRNLMRKVVWSHR